MWAADVAIAADAEFVGGPSDPPADGFAPPRRALYGEPMRAIRPHVPDAGGGRSAVSRADAQATLGDSLISLQRRVGNRAVGRLLGRTAATGLIQRKVGWTDAVKDGYAWNSDEKQRGSIRRIPLEDLTVGLPKDVPITSLTPERSDHRAIVLLPMALDARLSVEYVIFLHGHTESSSTRPYAGWRAYQPPPPPRGRTPPPPTPPGRESKVEKWRHGIDATDVAPVRDVALDQAEDQLEASKLTQLVIILPQGALTSQFGDAGDKNFDAGDYVAKIADRLLTERCWLDAKGTAITDTAPTTARITMAGHSGAGATLSHMATESVRASLPPGAKGAPDPVPSSPLPSDLVIFDAINGSAQLDAVQKWTLMRLDEDLKVLIDGTKNEDAKLQYLHTAPKLRGFYTDLYQSPYEDLERTIRGWFKKHAGDLGQFARCLRANFMLTYVGGEHEELMRGKGSGTTRSAGILTALLDLHRAMPASAADCPKMPEELAEEERQRKIQERRDRAKGRVKAPAAP
jgi:hypothetical protein